MIFFYNEELTIFTHKFQTSLRPKVHISMDMWTLGEFFKSHLQ